MRIPAWTPEQKHQPQDLVDAILARRGGELINLDRALLWSEPVARGWNVYLKNIRTGLPTSRKLCELGICTVALLTGAKYEYHHHAPDFLTAGGTQAELDALNRVVQGDPCQAVTDEALHEIERLVVQYAAQMTRHVKVDDALFAALQARFTTTEWSSPPPLRPTTWWPVSWSLCKSRQMAKRLAKPKLHLQAQLKTLAAQ
jgi:alkylhydroperoxidase family enzyme